jgi:hypothetical protein
MPVLYKRLWRLANPFHTARTWFCDETPLRHHFASITYPAVTDPSRIEHSLPALLSSRNRNITGRDLTAPSSSGRAPLAVLLP